MKKQIVLLFAVFFGGLVFTQCTSTDKKEEKALTLINDYMFKTLFYYDSYRPIETKIDSVIHSPYNDTTILRYAMINNEAMKQSEEYQEKAEKAMEIYRVFGDLGIKNHRDPQNEFMRNMDKSLSLIERSIAYNDSIRIGSRFIKPDFIGWAVTHKYYCKDTDTVTRVFYTDKNFTTITNVINIEDDDYKKCQKIIKEIIEMQ